MTNHPNRTPGRPGGTPRPAQIKAAREAAGLTQKAAADLVYASVRAWEKWEAPEGLEHHRRMPPGLWELFQLKCAGVHPATILRVFGGGGPT